MIRLPRPVTILCVLYPFLSLMPTESCAEELTAARDGTLNDNRSQDNRRHAAPSVIELFEDTFDRKKLGDVWRVHPNSFQIEEGVLVAAQRPDATHGAVCETFVDFKDIVLEFRFCLEDTSPGFNVVIDDRGYKQSHAGHICRVTVREKRIELRDDKTGAMKHGLFEKLQDARTRAEFLPLLAGKSQSAKVDVKRNRWYSLRVDITGQQMRVTFDDKLIGTLNSEGIGHATKTDFGFTVLGQSVRFDDVRATTARRDPIHDN